ncbi:glycosyl transferase family 2 [Fibrobacterales bacterium]|nr:glycosyl transferase family 2 [Fibrobacterales bacterium]
MQPLISVIIPVYNTEKYLVRCVESVIFQTYKNLQIILINDGSTDNSLEILQKYKSNDLRIEIIDQKNGGLSNARNNGLNIVKGEFITFVDSDDYCEKNMLEIAFSEMEQGDADVVWWGIAEKFSSGHIRLPKQREKRTASSLKECAEIFAETTSRVAAYGKLYKRYIFEKNRFPENKINEDIFIFPEIFSLAKNNIILSTPLYFHCNENADSLTAKFKLQNLDVLEAVDNFKNYEGMEVLHSQLLIRACYNLLVMMKLSFNSKDNEPHAKEILKILKKCKATYNGAFYDKFFIFLLQRSIPYSLILRFRYFCVKTVNSLMVYFSL